MWEGLFISPRSLVSFPPGFFFLLHISKICIKGSEGEALLTREKKNFTKFGRVLFLKKIKKQFFSCFSDFDVQRQRAKGGHLATLQAGCQALMEKA